MVYLDIQRRMLPFLLELETRTCAVRNKSLSWVIMSPPLTTHLLGTEGFIFCKLFNAKYFI